MHSRTGILRKPMTISALIAALALAVQPYMAQPAYAAGTLPPNNPPTSIAPNPDFYTSCPTTAAAANASTTCTATTVQAINNARAQEGVVPLVLPSNYTSLTPAAQLLEATGDERVDRGLSAPAGLVDAYNQESLTGANAGVDPVGPANTAWRSNYTHNIASTLEAMYELMYDDGPGGTNVDCTATNTSGCWDHRDGILGGPVQFGNGTIYMGAAAATTAANNYADILVDPQTAQTVVYPYSYGAGVSPPTTPTPTPTPSGSVSGSQYTSLPNPVRVTDTRPSSGYPNSGSPISFGTSINVSLASSAPTNATAVVLNVTAVDANASGFLTVYPTGATPPLASNLDFVAGAANCNTLDCVVPNLVTVPLGPSEQVSVYAGNAAGGTVDAVVDMEGYYVPTTSTGAGHYYPLSPQRLVDTRCGASPAPSFCPGDNLPAVNSGLTTVPAHGTLQFDTSPIPAPSGTVGSVVVNVTTTNTGSQGYLTAYPAGTTPPTASNANWVQGQISSSRVSVATGTGSAPGQVDLYNGSNSSVDVIVDASGYYSNASGSSTGGTLFNPVSPQRITDTRSGSGEPNAGNTIQPQGNVI